MVADNSNLIYRRAYTRDASRPSPRGSPVGLPWADGGWIFRYSDGIGWGFLYRDGNGNDTQQPDGLVRQQEPGETLARCWMFPWVYLLFTRGATCFEASGTAQTQDVEGGSTGKMTNIVNYLFPQPGCPQGHLWTGVGIFPRSGLLSSSRRRVVGVRRRPSLATKLMDISHIKINPYSAMSTKSTQAAIPNGRTRDRPSLSQDVSTSSACSKARVADFGVRPASSGTKVFNALVLISSSSNCLRNSATI